MLKCQFCLIIQVAQPANVYTCILLKKRSDRVYAHPNDTTVADAQFRKISNSAQGGRFALIL